jgi:hypothetical protein
MSNGTKTVNYTPGGADDPNNLFHYMPSMAPAVIGLVFYTSSFFALSVRTIWKRSWYMIVLLVGCLMEVIGYATRIPLVITTVGQRNLYICMNSCLILAPVFYAAIEYVLFGRLMHAVGDQYSLMKPKVIAWIFISSDIISLMIQGAGGGILSSAGTNSDSANLGENILLVGLAVNLASFAIFCLQIFYFDYRTRKSPPTIPGGGLCKKGWRQFLYLVYLSSLLVLIRQIYRVIEFSQGFTGYVAVHEIYFYIFDAIPIFFAGGIYIICFPANGYLPQYQIDNFANMEKNEQNLRQNGTNKVIPLSKDLVIDQKF